MVKAIYANLVVNDLQKSQEFFNRIGFSFNPKFTNDQAAALILSDSIVAMLHTPESMAKYTKKELVDAKKSTEVLLALQLDSKEEVDEIMEKVLLAGGNEQRDPESYDFMYARAFEDPDHHIWELFWMEQQHN